MRGNREGQGISSFANPKKRGSSPKTRRPAKKKFFAPNRGRQDKSTLANFKDRIPSPIRQKRKSPTSSGNFIKLHQEVANFIANFIRKSHTSSAKQGNSTLSQIRASLQNRGRRDISGLANFRKRSFSSTGPAFQGEAFRAKQGTTG